MVVPEAGKETKVRSARSLLLLPLLSLVGSCSYAYDLKAVIIDGRLAFIVDPSSDNEADCIDGIAVDAASGEPYAEPATGDDRGLVLNGGVYWWDFTDTCETPFPVFYGDKLKGSPQSGMGYVAPKPLKRGVFYNVTTTGSGSGSGGAWFKILPSGRVENYRNDPHLQEPRRMGML